MAKRRIVSQDNVGERSDQDFSESSIQNDYVLQSHDMVDNMIHYAFSAPDSQHEDAQAKEDAFLKRAGEGDYYQRDGLVRHGEITAWHVVLNPENNPIHQIYDDRQSSEGRKNDRGKRQSENFVMEHVQLYVNATIPGGVANTQIALCDRTSLCSLFVQSIPFEKTRGVEQRLDYTFTSVKYWGQRNPYDGGWIVMVRNVYPTQSAAIQVHQLTLRIHGHYA
jgi:hypothetical protein